MLRGLDLLLLHMHRHYYHLQNINLNLSLRGYYPHILVGMSGAIKLQVRAMLAGMQYLRDRPINYVIHPLIVVKVIALLLQRQILTSHSLSAHQFPKQRFWQSFHQKNVATI